MNSSKKVTVRFSKRLKLEMQRALVNSGYGLHGKSRWLKDAIENFMIQPNFEDYVEHGNDVHQAELDLVEAFYLDIKTLQLMKEGFIQLRTKYPLIEGIQSALIRAAIIHKLMLK